MTSRGCVSRSRDVSRGGPTFPIERRRTSSYLTESLRRLRRILERVTPQPSSLARLAAFGAALVAALAVSSGVSAAPACADAILSDWLDDSRIDRIYALPCYEAAIDSIPNDLRDYTDAADVIARAFQSVSGRRLDRGLEGLEPTSATPAVVPPVDSSSSTAVPVPILVLGGMSVALITAGGLGYLSRRRRESRGLE
jgi:hypothetical protein